MMIPFLWEIRVAMDWTVERTSLDLVSYVQLEDVYAGLCLVRASLYHRRFRKGKLQPRLNKVCQGCGFAFAMVLLVVGPLYLFSSVNPFFESNQLIAASMEMRIFTSLDHSTTNQTPATRLDFTDSAAIGGSYALCAARCRVPSSRCDIISEVMTFLMILQSFSS